MGRPYYYFVNFNAYLLAHFTCSGIPAGGKWVLSFHFLSWSICWHDFWSNFIIPLKRGRDWSGHLQLCPLSVMPSCSVQRSASYRYIWQTFQVPYPPNIWYIVSYIPLLLWRYKAIRVSKNASSWPQRVFDPEVTPDWHSSVFNYLDRFVVTIIDYFPQSLL